MTRTILIAGASGQLGRHILRVCHERGYRTRVLVRNIEKLRALETNLDEVIEGDLTKPTSLKGICTGIEQVISCAGASMNLKTFGDRHAFDAVDYRGNLALLKQAEAQGVGKFVYVSHHEADWLRHTAYTAGHEQFVSALKTSDLPYTVMRPTGFFSMFQQIFDAARMGMGLVIGSGEARTNPIHEADLAEVCVDALDQDRTEVELGGPEIYTRQQIVELAFAALDKKPRLFHVSPGLFRAMSAPLRLINPRLHGLMIFGIEVSLMDVVAPAYGHKSLTAYFEALAEVSAQTP
jgi:uncharacterized protein YbjT (DUF2867 family)